MFFKIPNGNYYLEKALFITSQQYISSSSSGAFDDIHHANY